ncbi:MAG: hypothetical protein IJB68_07810 [Ruminococcus sp.]|nr:hypothetical protein [Ruminococcus sp.]
MLPEEKARVKIDEKLSKAGWYIVDRDEYVPQTTSAIREALTQGNKESDYLFFIDNKAIAVLEAKRADNPLGKDVESQAENYASTPLSWYGLWENKVVRFDGWQNTTAGQKEVKKALRSVIWNKYKIHDNDVFNKAYSYIEEYY